MQLLDWVVVATVGAIVLVLLDGFRRKWRDRRNRVVMKLDRNLQQDAIDPEEFPNSELPNGGARTLFRDNEPPAISPLQRKRNYQLKDGRDKARTPEPEPGNVPVLMDPVEIEEAAIEHANVYVTAETTAAAPASDFADEELPPEVMAGLDGEFHDEHVANKQHSTGTEQEVSGHDEDVDSLTDDAAGQFVTADSDPLMDGFSNEESDDFDEALDDELEQQPLEENEEDEAHAADPDQHAVDALDAAPEHGDDIVDEHADAAATLSYDNNADTAVQHSEPDNGQDDGEDEQENEQEDELGDEEEYDPTQDEHYYENEPALLENAYRLATSRFQRQPKQEPLPRIEPGFGDAQAEPEESTETFGAIIDDSAMTEFLADEQEQIRAWSNQSATRQREPAAAEAVPVVVPVVAIPAPAPAPVSAPEPVKPAPQVTPVYVEPRIINIQPEPEPAADWSVEPLTALDPIDAAPALTVAPVATPKEAKPGFWQSMTGKSNKPVRVEPPRIDQGELFKEPEPRDEPEDVVQGPQEVIIVNVMSKPDGVFHGEELMPVLQHYGLRLGNMKIFHRHTEVDGSGPIMFSMANMVKPGTFSLGDMEDFATPGLSFFVQLPNRHGNMQAFELMLATANGVKQALDGVLKDERRSVLTRQTVEHCRQRIRDFELSLLSRK